ncbi:hypothetical protein, partial [Burkholderia ambifaria]|uniref:hypothetical protein n=1 Tax=Burkholderia ambifaria TaxID=152480 RepID=UPI0018E08DBB
LALGSTESLRQRLGLLRREGLGGGGSKLAGKLLAKKTKKYIAENLIHEIRDDGYTMFSRQQFPDETKPYGLGFNVFSNKYKPHKWTFKSNFREYRDVPYYASDIARYQYNEVSKLNKFKGQLPSIIKRKEVINQLTLEMTDGKIGDDLFSIFFRTPNGKSTSRIMEEFGLKATSVERIFKDGDINFIIHVMPE